MTCVTESSGSGFLRENMKTFLKLSICLLALSWLTSCGGGSFSSSATANAAPLLITSGIPPTGTSGTVYAGGSGFAFTASGGVAPYTWSWLAAANSSLPPGLALTNSSIVGTPTTAGAYSVDVSVRDSASPASTKSANYVVSIDMPLEITSGTPPSGTLGTTYGALGTAYFSCVWSPVLGWHWACTPCNPAVPGSCPAAPCRGISFKRCLQTQQVPMGFTFAASGGTSPYSWSASDLPAGLELDTSTGKLSGTPTTTGSYSIILTVSDSESPPVQTSASYSIDISN